MLRETIRNHDFHDITALQCWNNFVAIRNNVATRGGGGGKRRGLGPRNDVLTTCKAITLHDVQGIIAAFSTVNTFRLLRSK